MLLLRVLRRLTISLLLGLHLARGGPLGSGPRPQIANNRALLHRAASSLLVGSAILFAPVSSEAAVTTFGLPGAARQSPGWDLVREKRTLAIKVMESKGIVKVQTDDTGNQFLALPWLPDKRIPYKSLPLARRLQNEVCAGAFGEISKDALLHAVDTFKTRKQAAKKEETPSNSSLAVVPENPLAVLKGLYAGFPVVFLSSIPQGGTFFLVKTSVIEAMRQVSTATNPVLMAIVPIMLAVMGYWAFRTPAEVIKTQVQTGQSPNCLAAVNEFRGNSEEGLRRLWRYYPVMLWLDVPFQVLNFAMLTALSDAVKAAGFPTSVLTRLFCGVTCGMISAGVTCPIDVCKTRILARDKAAQAVLQAASVTGDPELRESSANTSSSLDLSSSHPVMLNGTREIDVLISEFDEMLHPGSAESQWQVAEGSTLVVDRSTCIVMDDSPVQLDTSSSPSIPAPSSLPTEEPSQKRSSNRNVIVELVTIYREEGIGTLFLGLRPRLLYTGLANGIRIAAYGTSRMDLMMRSLDDM